MKTVLDRFRELAGIVESRPAYNVELNEENWLREAIEARVNSLNEWELDAEIRGVIAERVNLALQLEARGLVEGEKHYLKKTLTAPGQGHEVHAVLASLASRTAKAPLLTRKLSGLRIPKKPDPLWHEKHSGLQHGDTPSTDKRSAEAKAEHSRRAHAMAAFHHFQASQDHKKLGNKRQEMQHRLASEAHHKRAQAREGSAGGSYMFHPKTGKHIDWTPVYDKTFAKAEKNKISRKKREAEKKLKVWKSKEAA